MINRFTQKSREALEGALNNARELGHSYVGTEHLLLSLSAVNDSIAAKVLVQKGADEKRLRRCIEELSGIGNKSTLDGKDITPKLRRVIEGSSAEATRADVHFIGTEHLLLSLLSQKDCVAIRILESDGISPSELKADICAYVGVRPHGNTKEEEKKKKKHSLGAYSKELTSPSALKKADPVFCRDGETERLIRILCRRSKNNPCLVGEPGVGKTAVVEGLAKRISEGSVPNALLGKKIFALDFASMLAGAKYRGEFEERLKSIIKEAENDPNIILFADEMHIMVGAGSAEGAIDASNILKPALSRGEIRMIGATTPTEYRLNIEKDTAFERRFQAVQIKEPSENDSIKILCGLKEKYEKHHSVSISDEAIEAAVRLSQKYIKDRFLPDKAVDLIDEACSALKLSESEEKEKSISHEEEIEQAILSQQFQHAHELADRKRSSLSTEATVLSALEDELVDAEKVNILPQLSSHHIAKIISEQTGIPCGTLEESESEMLKSLEDTLHARVIGQNNAVHTVAEAVKRGRTGIREEGRPVCSFLFLGSTGVGKSELCMALGEALFGSRDAVLRFDMSEYMEQHSTSKLIGAPPGYVGYKDGGLLTEKIRRQPYSVILFDEIEKAHSDVFNLLLQILENGRLRDSSGRECDFSSSVIIMTSNLLSSTSSRHSFGFSDTPKENRTKELRTDPRLLEFFRPELLNRIDNIILFETLGEDELEKITSLSLERLCDRVKKNGIQLSLDPQISKHIAKFCLSSATSLGARPIRRKITELLETPISEALIKSEYKLHQGIKITAYLSDGEIKLDISI